MKIFGIIVSILIIFSLIGLTLEYKNEAEKYKENLHSSIVKNNDLIQLVYKQEQEIKILEKEKENLKTQTFSELKDFDSINELTQFLEEDKINENKYSKPDFDCEDFSLMLIKNAAKDGFRLYTQMFFNEMIGEWHMVNFAIIWKTNKIIFIEPQTDKIWEGPYID